jgi:hypothetical protein
MINKKWIMVFMILNKKIARVLLGTIYCLLSLTVPLFAQEAQPSFFSASSERGEFWISPSIEAALYSTVNISYGPGFAMGYGKGNSIGLKCAIFLDAGDKLDAIEINFLLRRYLLGAGVSSGPFFQFVGGPVVFLIRDKNVSLPADLGSITAGIGFGWRLYIDEYLFVEPSIRVGYPYIAGIALAGGIRF